MNKISKKILAIVTMAAFVVTMMPFAAFAAVSSTVQVDSDSQEVTLRADEYGNVSTTADVIVTLGEKDLANAQADKNVYVWVEKGGAIYRDAEFSQATTGKNGDLAYAGVFNQDSDIKEANTMTITFKEAGDYTVYAGIEKPSIQNRGGAQSTDDLDRITAVSGQDVIKVVEADTYVDKITVSNDVAYTPDYIPNGINALDATVTVDSNYVDTEDGDPSSEGILVDVVNPYNNIHVQQDGKDVDQIEIGSDDTAAVKIIADSGIRAGVYTITFKADGESAQLKVTVPDENATAKTIDVVDTGSDVISYNTSVGDTLEKAVQFSVKDTNGNEMTPDKLSGQDAWTAADNNPYVVNAPDNSTATFKLAAADSDEDIVTLELKSGKLLVGEYTVRVALNAGDSADVTFTVARFGDPTDLKIVVEDNKDAESTSNLPMDTEKDATYSIKAVWVDENGVEEDANAAVGIQTVSGSGITYDAGTLTIPKLVKTGDNANDSLIGSTVTVWATDATNGFNVSREFTITDPANTDGIALAFDSESGEVERNNTVNVTVVNEDGETVDGINVDDTSKLLAYVADKSNEDAYVTAQLGKVENGEAELTVYADQETTAEIVVAVIDGNNKYYGGTLNYTFGEADVNADTTVAMTIGSSDIIVNNDIVSGDAAPFVDSNWRTMVPVRALSEAFGGSAEWDGDARTVTVVNGDTTIVFNADSDKYTVNGEEKTMDTELTIVDGRTYVPVRFVADELGYQITVLKDAQGLTAGVVFQK